jgi:hypothetical protein
MNLIPINCVYVDVRKVYDDVSKKVTAEKLLDKLHSSLVSLSKKRS